MQIAKGVLFLCHLACSHDKIHVQNKGIKALKGGIFLREIREGVPPTFASKVTITTENS